MALINRISKLFAADLHAVLDRIEEPEALLRQAIREMEEELAGAEHRVAALDKLQRQLARRYKEIEESAGDIESQLDVCFESGEDDLARGLLRRRLETQKLAKSVAAKAESTGKALEEQRSALDENRAQLARMRQKAEVLIEERSPDTGSPDILWSERKLTVTEDEIEVAFLREKQRRGGS